MFDPSTALSLLRWIDTFPIITSNENPPPSLSQIHNLASSSTIITDDRVYQIYQIVVSERPVNLRINNAINSVNDSSSSTPLTFTTPESLYAKLSTHLCNAVIRSDKVKRNDYVTRIMTVMNEGDKKCLMGVISADKQENDDDDDNDRNSAKIDNTEEEGVERIKNLLSTSQTTTANLQLELKKQAAFISDLKSEHLQHEITINDKHDHEMSKLNLQIAKLTNENSTLNQASQTTNDLQNENRSLKDQVDILLPSSISLPLITETLKRTKAKLENLSDVNRLYEVSKSENGVHIDSIVNLENEVSLLKSKNVKLSSYRDDFLRVQGEFDCLQLENVKLKNLVGKLEKSGGEMKASYDVTNEESVMLQRKLVESYCGDDNNTNDNNLSVGISEYNPEINEELTRLRNQHSQMTANMEKFNVKAYEELEKNYEDCKLKADGVLKKFVSTKSLLEVTQGELRGAREDVRGLRCDIEELNEIMASNLKIAEELQDMAAEENATKIHSLNVKKRNTERKANATVTLIKVGSAALVSELNDVIYNQDEVLVRKSTELANMKASLSQLNSRLDEMSNKHDSLHVTHGKYKSTHSLLNTAIEAKRKEYKYKLTISASKLSNLEIENEALSNDKRKMQLDSMKLREDLDKYRKTESSANGIGCERDSQLEVVSRELRGLIEENARMKGSGYSGSSSSSGSEGGTSNKNNYTSNQSLHHLHNQYETKITKLNAERRELIMRNSSAVSDLQKVQRECYTLSREVESLEGVVKSLELKVERFESGRGNSGGSGGKENMFTLYSPVKGRGGSERVQPLSASKNKKNVQQDLLKKTPPKTKAAIKKKPASLLDNVNNAGSEKAGEECTQS